MDPVELAAVDPGSPEAQAALARYFGELESRFAFGFDPTAGAAAGIEHLRPPGGVFFVLSGEGGTVGCGGVHRLDDDTAEIKRMWIDPAWRGRGLARRLLAALEDAARDRGHRRVVLDTNAALVEAIALYERAGYQAVERYNDNPYADHWFAKPL